MAETAHKTLVARKPRGVRAHPPVRTTQHAFRTAAPVARTAEHRPLLQPALKVGAANDPLEREAETTAERIVAMPAPRLDASPDAAPAGAGGGGGAEARRDTIDDQPSTDELEGEPPVPADHQDPEVPPQEDVTAEGLTADDMKEIETGSPQDTAGDPPAEEAPLPPGEDTAQPARGDGAVVGAEGGAAPPDVARRVAQPGSGRPLPRSVRAFMEPRFGKDFSAVRIHDGPEDRRAASRIGARAFTHRDHIWMGPGESVEDRHLLAHELTHVVQQTSPGPARGVDRATEDGEPQLRRGYILDKAEKYARNVPGYRLISVILGKSPITGDRVERNAVNLLGAMMALIPGGNLLFERLEEARVIQDAFDWVSSRLSSLNITWSRITGIIDDIIDYMPDWPSDMIAYARKKLAPLVDDILTFIGEVTGKILEFIVRGALKLAGPWGEKVWGVIQRAGSVLMTILKDPLGFAKNLFSAVLKGFKQFGSNIWNHIKKGLLGWLFGTLRGLDLQMPERLDFKGLISIGLQIVGLTYANFRKILVKRLGANGERKVKFLEKSVEVVKILVKEGFVGLWQRALQMIDNFKETVIGGIRNFVIEKLIMGGLTWLAGLSNPVGAVVKVVLSIYNMIKTFLERLDQILEVAESIFSSIGEIAAGRIQQAADFIERTIAATIPVVISFLAALVPITGITNAIRNIIAKLRAAVERAIDKMVAFVVKKAKKLFSLLIGKLNSRRSLPSANFQFGKRQHRIFAEKAGKGVEVRIASLTGYPPKEVAAAEAEEAKKLKDKKAQAEAGEITSEVKEADDETGKEAKPLKPDSQKDNQLKGFAALEAELKEAATELQQAGADTASYPEIDTEQAKYLFRAKEPRFDTVEGGSGEYSALGKVTSQTIVTNGAKDPAGRRYSDFYENDHIPEKQYAKAILANIDKFKPSAAGGNAVDRGSEKADAKPEEKDAAKPKVGQLGETVTSIPKDGTGLQAMSIYRPVHLLKKSTPPAEVTKKVEGATSKPDPVAAIKKEISDEITLEANKISEIIRKDASATETIKGAIDTGVAKLVEANKAFYALDKVEEPAKAAAPGAKPDASLSELPVTGGGDVPNFLDVEGQYQPHGNFNPGFGKYMEYDHVIDAAWPRHTKGLTFGHPILREKLKAPLAAANLDTSDKALSGRISSLGQKKLFSAKQQISSYEFKTGYAIALYRPVHRAVTRSTTPPTSSDIPAGKVTDAFVEPLVNFIRSGDLTELEAARTKAQADLKKTFVSETDHHIDEIANQYVHELRAVKAVNKGKENEAQQAMMKISGNVRDNLQKARNRTTQLF